MSPRLNRLGKITHLVASAALIFALTYYLGYTVLSGPLRGNDSALHLGYGRWLDQYFPQVPNWYPLQGGGQSLLHGYPLLAHLLLVGLHRLSGLSLLQAFRLISFGSLLLSALGIYFYGWSVLRNQTVGLIAAIFYLAAPITWTWMYDWGFFPQQVAYVFLPPALIDFDQWLSVTLNKSPSRLRWIWFTSLIILVLLATFSHVLVATAIAAGMALYTVFAALVAQPGSPTPTGQPSPRWAILRRGITLMALTGLVVGVLTAFYLIPFYAYGQVANREGLNTPTLQQLHRLPVLEFFGLRPINSQEILTRMQFPLVVTLFAVIGLGLAVIFARQDRAESRKVLAWALAGIAATVYALTPELVAVILNVSPFLMFLVNFRSLLLLVMLLMPVMAAYGVWSLTHALFHRAEIFGRQRPPAETPSTLSRLSTHPALVSPAALLIALVGLGGIGVLIAKEHSLLTYGPLPNGIDLSDIWHRRAKAEKQLEYKNWPAFALDNQDPDLAYSQRLAALLPDTAGLRLDLSPYLGRLAEDLTGFTHASQINSYTYQITLIHAMWGYQQNVFYSHEPSASEYGTPQTLNELAQWFGTQYVFLNPQQDPSETYQAAGWQPVFQEKEIQVWEHPTQHGYLFLHKDDPALETYRQAGWHPIAFKGPIELWRYPTDLSLATLTTRPTLLVIG